MGYLKEDIAVGRKCRLDEPEVVDNSRFERFGDIMVDLETLGTRQDTIVLEISAVEFNRYTGEIGEVFDAKLDIDDQLSYRRSLSRETLQWWFKQDEAAIKNVFDNVGAIKFETSKALFEFSHLVEMIEHTSNSHYHRRGMNIRNHGSHLDR